MLPLVVVLVVGLEMAAVVLVAAGVVLVAAVVLRPPTQEGLPLMGGESDGLYHNTLNAQPASQPRTQPRLSHGSSLIQRRGGQS